MSLRIGDLELQVVSGGRLWVDGGGMFGVVPKVMWERKCGPDGRNRIPLDTNCLLARGRGRTILIDTGYGGKCTPRERDNYGLDAGFPLLDSLATAEVRPGDVDAVILTHLHFDHAGGCTMYDDAGQIGPVFPRARHIVQKTEWEDAVAELPELAGNYFGRDFLPLAERGLVDVIDGDTEALPGVFCRLTGGHSRGHQVVILGDGRDRAIYLADLCPTTFHLRTSWTMAYDQFPREVRRAKVELLGQAADNNWAVLFNHDLETRAARLARDDRHDFVIRESISI